MTRLVARKDSQGNVIGFDTVDENGVVVGGANRPTNPQAPTPPPSTGGESSLPGQTVRVQTEAYERSSAASSSSGSGSTDEGGYYVPPELMTQSGQQQPDAEGQTQRSARERPRGDISGLAEQGVPHNANDATTFGESRRRELDRQTREGNIFQQGLARVQLGANAIQTGFSDAIAETLDFGSAVVDVIRGNEINDADNTVANFFRPQGAPTSGAGRFAQETGNFVASMATTGNLVGKIPFVANLARGGFAARAGAEAIKGAAVDFIRAKPAEENLFNLLQGSPLETPVSRFLAADMDADANYWMTKTKEAMGGVVLGVTFDLFGESVQVAAKAAREGPMEVLMNGLRNAKSLDGDAERLAMVNLDQDLTNVTVETQQTLSAAINEELGQRVSSARRLLEDVELPRVDDIPAAQRTSINEFGDDVTPTPNLQVERFQELEEEMVRLSDLRKGLYDLGVDADVDELDRTLIELTDKFDEVAESFRPSQAPVEIPEAQQGLGVTPQELRQLDAEAAAREPQPLEELFNQADDISARSNGSVELEVTYRTKPEIRRDIARKALNTRLSEANADLVNEAVDGLVRPRRAPRQARALALSKKDFRSRLLESNANGDSVGRFINVDKLTNDQDVKDLLLEVMSAIDETKITGRLTDAQVQRRASNLVNGLSFLDDANADKILEAYAGVSSNVPDAQLAIRMLTEDMATQVSDAANSLAVGKGLNDLTIPEMMGDADLAYKLSRLDYFMNLNKNLGAVQGQGLRARGLSVDPAAVAVRESQGGFDELYRSASELTENPDEMKDAILDMLSTPAGRKQFDKIKADLGSAKGLDDVAAATRSARFAILNNTSKLIQGVRMNAILSGTRSNLTNVVSNAAMMLYAPLTQATGALIDIPYQSLKGNPAGVTASREALQQAIGMYSGMSQHFSDSIQMARRAFKQGRGILSEDQVLKEADQLQLLQSLDGDGFNSSKALAHTLSLPSRLLVTGDEFFKQMNYRSFVTSKASIEGAKRGLRGKALRDYIDTTLNNSFHKVDAQHGLQGLGLDPNAREYSEFVTFQSDINSDNSRLRRGAVGFVDWLRSVPGGDILASAFVPFIKTPANIMGYTARNSPLGFISKGWRQDFAAGGAKRARALGEFTLGTVALGGIMNLSMQGKLTGRAPSDPAAREQWFAQGYQPYSIRIGNKWMSFERLEPFAGHFALVADMMAATSMAGKSDGINVEETQANIVGAFIAAVRNRTFFQGIADLVDLFDAAGSTDPRYKNTISGKTQQIAATLMPYSSFLNEQRRARDNTLREAEGLVDQLMNKIPGMSEQLPAQINWLTGKPITYASNPVFNLYPSSQMQNDPLIKNLLRYNVGITPPDKNIRGGVELSNEQYEQLLRLTGQIEIQGKTQYQALQDVFNSFDTSVLDKELDYLRENDDYARSTPLAVEVAAVRRQYNQAAEAALVRLNPELIEQVRQGLTERGNVKEGLFWMNSPLYGQEGLQDAQSPELLERLGSVQQSTNRSLESLVEGPGELNQ